MHISKGTRKKSHTHKNSGYITLMLLSGTSAVKSLRLSKTLLWFMVFLFATFVTTFIWLVQTNATLLGNRNFYKNKIYELETKIVQNEQKLAELKAINHEYNTVLYTLVDNAYEMQHQITQSMNQIMLDKVLIDTKMESIVAYGQPITVTPIANESIVSMHISDRSGGNRPPIHVGTGNLSFFEQIRTLENTLSQNTRIIDEHLDIYKDSTDTVDEIMPYMLSYPSILPLEGRITSPMGWRNDPLKPSRRQYHTGIDLAASMRSPVMATGAGTVLLSTFYGGYGYTVIIDHGYGLTTLYAHNAKLLVKKGDSVFRGDVIALSGMSGRSTGPHVHYEIRLKDIPKDPLSYIIREE